MSDATAAGTVQTARTSGNATIAANNSFTGRARFMSLQLSILTSADELTHSLKCTHFATLILGPPSCPDFETQNRNSAENIR